MLFKSIKVAFSAFFHCTASKTESPTLFSARQLFGGSKEECLIYPLQQQNK
jgi:hypothetical protein